MIVDSVAAQGGVTCVNTTAVLVEGDPTELAEALAQRLSALPSLPPQDSDAVLPVHPSSSAHALARYLQDQAAGTRAVLGADGVVDELGDGSAVLRPAVHVVDSPFAAQVGIELPFPCVWVAPWNRQAGAMALRNSLVLTAVTGDDELFETLLTDPSIRNLYRGHRPTHWMGGGVPHDGFLGEFLMRSKGISTAVTPGPRVLPVRLPQMTPAGHLRMTPSHGRSHVLVWQPDHALPPSGRSVEPHPPRLNEGPPA
jgi:hypothetical protein